MFDYKNIYDDVETIEIVFRVSDSALYRLPLGILFTVNQIWTGSGQTGTNLIIGTDYAAGGNSGKASEIKGESVYTGFQIINAVYHSTDLYATITWVGNLGNNSTIYRDVSEIKTFPVYKDRTSSRLLPFNFNNAVKKIYYNDLYEQVGDMFEAQHVAAGDAASASDEFYPTPIPGAYGRTALPDFNFTEANISGNNILLSLSTAIDNLRDGTPLIFKVVSGTAPTGISDGQLAFCRFDTNGIYMYSTESGAIGNEGRILLSDAGSGSFRLTQEGVEIGFATSLDVDTTSPGSGTGTGIQYANENGTGPVVQRELGTSNETRPITQILFSYIRY